MMFLAGCLNNDVRIEYRNLVPDVDETLRTPVTVPDRAVGGLASVGVIVTDHIEALGIANGRIIAFDCIMDAAESGTEPDCFPE